MLFRTLGVKTMSETGGIRLTLGRCTSNQKGCTCNLVGGVYSIDVFPFQSTRRYCRSANSTALPHVSITDLLLFRERTVICSSVGPTACLVNFWVVAIF